MRGTLLHHWLRYALYLYPSTAVVGIYQPPTSLPNLTCCLLYYLSTADDRTMHVKHMQNASYLKHRSQLKAH